MRKTAQRTTRTTVDRTRRGREAWIFLFRRIRMVKGRGKRKIQPRIHKKVIPSLWRLAWGAAGDFRLAAVFDGDEFVLG